MSTIAAGTTLTTALVQTGDTTGTLVIQTNGTTTAATFTTGQVLNLTNPLPAASGGTGINTVGTAGNVLTSNGTTWVSSAPSSGPSAGISWQSVQTGNFTAVAGRGYPVNTTSASITVTLPATPSVGDVVWLVDYAGTWDTNGVVVARNGSNIVGSATDRRLNQDREGIGFVYVDATQGWIPYSGFNAITPIANTFTLDYLVVAGGGGGGGGTFNNANGGGGGGGGGMLEGSITATLATSYTVTVGAGGAGGDTSTGVGANGSNSVFSTNTSTGGGGGGSEGRLNNGQNGKGSNGGSGGGSSQDVTNVATGTAGQGNNGGENVGFASGGGGGGKGSAGSNSASLYDGGNGGSAGTSSISGTSTGYAGGGGGGAYFTGSGGTPGTNAGKGGESGLAGGEGQPGTANRGGGGGGSENAGGQTPGGNGGSGVVIVKYPDAYTVTNPGGGLTFSTSSSGGFKVTTFTAGTGSIQLS